MIGPAGDTRRFTAWHAISQHRGEGAKLRECPSEGVQSFLAYLCVEHIKHQQFPKAAEFEKFLQTSGQTVSDLMLRVKLNLLSQKIQEKIVKSKPTISHAEAEKYYNENKSKYGAPEKRNVEMILTKTEQQAKEAKKEIEEGNKTFAEVAKARSIDPTSKAKGGQLGVDLSRWVKKDEVFGLVRVQGASPGASTAAFIAIGFALAFAIVPAGMAVDNGTSMWLLLTSLCGLGVAARAMLARVSQSPHHLP